MGVVNSGTRAYSSTVIHALRVLELLKNSWEPLGVRRIARDLGMSAASVHRILKSLQAFGFVQQSEDDRAYRLGWGLLDYSGVMLTTTRLSKIAADSARRLRDVTGETVTVQERVGNDRVCVLSEEGTHQLRRHVPLGRRVPLFAGASGRAVLALLPTHEIEAILAAHPTRFPADGSLVDETWLRNELEATRTSGLAVSIGETVADVSSSATPILRFDGLPAGSIAVSGPAARWTLEAIANHRVELLRIGLELSRYLGFRGSVPWTIEIGAEPERRSPEPMRL
jgi:DNA-binding IclR family transcriptional regulator